MDKDKKMAWAEKQVVVTVAGGPSTDGDKDVDVVEQKLNVFAAKALAAAIEAYEREAWTRITDDPFTWPLEGRWYLGLDESGDIDIVEMHWDDGPVMYDQEGRRLAITHWRLFPPGPGGGK